MDSSDYKQFKQDKLPTNRSFGITFGIIFLLFAGFAKYRNINERAFIFLIAGGLLFIVAFFFESILAVPNRLWNKFGKALSQVVNPIVLSLLFFIVITPAGLILRKLKILDYKNEFKAKNSSFWIKRDQESQSKERIEMQF